jgi:hypothetical protein
MDQEQQTQAQNSSPQIARREFIQKSLMLSGAAFVGMSAADKLSIPKLSSSAMPYMAATNRGNNGVGNGEDPQPPGDPPINDGPGTGPGNPGNNG